MARKKASKTVTIKSVAEELLEDPLTPEQEVEWVKCATDKEYWMQKYCFVQGDKGKTLFNPRPYQKRIIDTISNNFSIVLCPRQAGKSTTVGLDLLHKAIFFKEISIGVTSYKLINVKDYINRIKFTYERLPNWMKPAVEEYNRYNITFTNGSSFIGQVTTEGTFRGLTLTDIVCDELAFVKLSVSEDFWTSLLPSISASGNESTTRVIIISTPNGTVGTFAQIWNAAVEGSNGFAWTKVDYDEVPGRDEKFKKSMISKMGRKKFLQEFCCVFLSSKKTLINSMVLENIKTIKPVEVVKDLRIYVDDFTDRVLAMACDPAEGVEEDSHAIQIIDIATMEQVAEYSNNVLPQSMFTKDIIKTIKFLFVRGAKDIYFTVENNGVGQGVMRLLENVSDPVYEKATLVSPPEAKKLGITTTGTNKLAGCSDFKDLVETNKLKINSEILLNQLKFFVKSGASFKAETGAHDDLCMGMVILMNLLTILKDYEDDVHDTMCEINDFEDEGDDELWGICF